MIHTANKDVIARTQALCIAFGWQGGTVHQVAEVTGCAAHDLIYADAVESDISHKQGWFAYRTCELAFNAPRVEEKKGDLQFWLGVASGVQTSIKMQQPTPRKF